MEKKSSACQYSACPDAVEHRPPYDEFCHEVDGNILSVKVTKNFGKIQNDAQQADSSDCGDESEFNFESAKVNVIPNKAAPAKLPDTEQIVLRATKQLIGSDEVRNSLEIELRTPRNYEPLQ
ncbi:uncharacterized protein LOC106644935 [Copidosoma floridanum]|uniref:uncharacterized protein LOC106644935 n=1 Tax=Copidosoma floridanum TaxID=29053 RepID=UPI000C6FB828|nr:uncharacterized protein LOC106644935 [Copidosoma floridanum]